MQSSRSLKSILIDLKSKSPDFQVSRTQVCRENVESSTVSRIYNTVEIYSSLFRPFSIQDKCASRVRAKNATG